MKIEVLSKRHSAVSPGWCEAAPLAPGILWRDGGRAPFRQGVQPRGGLLPSASFQRRLEGVKKLKIAKIHFRQHSIINEGNPVFFGSPRFFTPSSRLP
jgi:hypothetical protein